jgi:hypothetical protein
MAGQLLKLAAQTNAMAGYKSCNIFCITAACWRSMVKLKKNGEYFSSILINDSTTTKQKLDPILSLLANAARVNG